MILKIRTNLGYVVYDRLKRVHYGYSGSPSRYALDQTGTLVNAEGKTACVDASWPLPESSLPRPLAWACSRGEDGDEVLYVFDEAYLMDDNGRTLEVIS